MLTIGVAKIRRKLSEKLSSRSGASGAKNKLLTKKLRSSFLRHLPERGRENSSFPVEEGSPEWNEGRWKTVGFQEVIGAKSRPTIKK